MATMLIVCKPFSFQSDDNSAAQTSELSTTSRYVQETLEVIRSLVDK